MNRKFWSKRSTYAVVGYGIGLAIGLVIMFFLGWKHVGTLLTVPPLLGMVVALWWAEGKGLIPSVEDENRPVTLFGKDAPPHQGGRPPAE